MQELKEFKLHQLYISTEALSVHMPNRNMISNFTSMVDKFKIFIGVKLPDINGDMAKLTKTSVGNELLTKVSKLDYKDLRKVTVQVPEGLSVDLLTYVKSLNASQEKIANMYVDILNPFSRVLGSIISRPKEMSSITSTLKIKVPSSDELRKDFSLNYKGNGGTIVPYTRAVRRQADVIPLVQNTLELTINLNAQPTELIADSVRELTDSLAKISSMANDPNSHLSMSSKMISQLADLTYSIAEMVSFYSTLIYATDEISLAVDKMIHELGAEFNQKK